MLRPRARKKALALMQTLDQTLWLCMVSPEPFSASEGPLQRLAELPSSVKQTRKLYLVDTFSQPGPADSGFGTWSSIDEETLRGFDPPKSLCNTSLYNREGNLAEID